MEKRADILIIPLNWNSWILFRQDLAWVLENVFNAQKELYRELLVRLR